MSDKPKHKILPLKNLKSSSIKYYFVFCRDDGEFIKFMSENSYLRSKYKFVQFNGRTDLDYIKKEYGFRNSKIMFTEGWCQKYEHRVGSPYIAQVEFAHCIANNIPIPMDLLPDSIKNLMNDKSNERRDD